MGGYSGEGIYPVALRMVWQVYKAVKIPIIGMVMAFFTVLGMSWSFKSRKIWCPWPLISPTIWGPSA